MAPLILHIPFLDALDLHPLMCLEAQVGGTPHKLLRVGLPERLNETVVLDKRGFVVLKGLELVQDLRGFLEDLDQLQV